MESHIFLDLEDTVIEPLMFGTSSWYSSEYILHNIESIKTYIAQERQAGNSVFVHLFSFAVHDVHELAAFNQGCRPHLETLLGETFKLTPTVDDDIKRACCRERSMAPSMVEFSEIVEFWGKQDSFKMYVRDFFKKRNNQNKTKVTLFDDSVFDETFHWIDINLTGNIIKV